MGRTIDYKVRTKKIRALGRKVKGKIMKRDILFLGMDIVKQLDFLKTESEKATGVVFNEEQKYGYECAKNMLNTILNDMLDEEETCVVHINGLEGQEEFFKTDLFKYFIKNGFILPEVK